METYIVVIEYINQYKDVATEEIEVEAVGMDSAYRKAIAYGESRYIRRTKVVSARIKTVVR